MHTHTHTLQQSTYSHASHQCKAQAQLHYVQAKHLRTEAGHYSVSSLQRATASGLGPKLVKLLNLAGGPQVSRAPRGHTHACQGFSESCTGLQPSSDLHVAGPQDQLQGTALGRAGQGSRGQGGRASAGHTYHTGLHLLPTTPLHSRAVRQRTMQKGVWLTLRSLYLQACRSPLSHPLRPPTPSGGCEHSQGRQNYICKQLQFCFDSVCMCGYASHG